MSERLRPGQILNNSIKSGVLALSLLLHHGTAHTFEIKPRSDFKTGIEEVRRGALEDDFESVGYLAALPSAQAPTLMWAGSVNLEKAGGFAPNAGKITSLLQGTVPEVGGDFTVYDIHSHQTSSSFEGIDKSLTPYSIPPSAEDIIRLFAASEAGPFRYGSRLFLKKHAASDGAGTWFLEKIPGGSTTPPSSMAIAYHLEGFGRVREETALFKWVEACALAKGTNAEDVDRHVRRLMLGDFYKALIDVYRKLGVEAKYVLWSDIREDNFPVSKEVQK